MQIRAHPGALRRHLVTIRPHPGAILLHLGRIRAQLLAFRPRFAAVRRVLAAIRRHFVSVRPTESSAVRHVVEIGRHNVSVLALCAPIRSHRDRSLAKLVSVRPHLVSFRPHSVSIRRFILSARRELVSFRRYNFSLLPTDPSEDRNNLALLANRLSYPSHLVSFLAVLAKIRHHQPPSVSTLCGAVRERLHEAAILRDAVVALSSEQEPLRRVVPSLRAEERRCIPLRRKLRLVVSHKKQVIMPRSITSLTLSQYRALVAGIPTYCPSAIFTVAGQTFTSPEAVTFINSVLGAVATTATAKGAWKEAILAEEKIVAQDGATVKEIRNIIGSMFSNAINTLTAFEITPRKPYTPLSAAKRAAATAKAKATRLARGTASKKQKALVSGDVTGVTITPVTGTGSAVPTGTAVPGVTGSAGAVSAAAPAVPTTAPAAVSAAPAQVTAAAVSMPTK